MLRREVVDDQLESHEEAASGTVQDVLNSSSSEAPQPVAQPYQEEDAAETTSGDPQAVDHGRATSTRAKRTLDQDGISE